MQSITITVNQAVRATGVSRTTIYKLIRERRLETVKIGARRLVTTKSILTLVGGEEVLEQ